MNKDKFYILFFFGLVSVFFYQTIFFGKLPVPSDTLVGLYHPWRDLYANTNPRGVPFKNFLITDPIRQQIPWRKIVIDSWKTGTVPKFNPYSFAGVPIDANIQAAPFYPLNILFILFSFPVAWTMLIIIQPLLAGLFLYVYLRNSKISSIASLLGAISWGFSGFGIAWLTWGTMMQTALWLPLILLSIDRKRVIVGSIGLVMAITAGHAQIALYVVSCAFLYALWKQARIKTLFMFFIAGIITIPAWLPLLQYLPETLRISADDSWQKAGWFMPWQHMVQFIAPDFFGNPSTLNYWGQWNYGEFIGFIGVIPLVFALSVFFSPGIATFFSIIVVLALLFLLPTPISYVPFLLKFPIISVLQPTRLLFLVDISLAILAAIGFDAWLQKKNKYLIKINIVLCIIFIFLWAQRLVPEEYIAVTHRNLVLPSLFFSLFLILNSFFRSKYIIIGLVVLELFRFGWKFTPFTDPQYFFPKTKIITFLQNQPKPFRVMSMDDRILPPNVSAYYGIETIEGYDPLVPKLYHEMLVALDPGKGFNRIYTTQKIQPYANIRFVLSLEDRADPFLREVMREGDTRVYEYAQVLPRVYLNNGSAIIEKYTGNSLLVRVVGENPDTFIFLNLYDKRWKATLDGTYARIYKTNFYYMGIDVPQGEHTIELFYE